MTQLERTIKQILSERMKTANLEGSQRDAQRALDQRSKRYDEEFDSIYRDTESIEQIGTEFVEWADQCTIDDKRK